MGTALARHGLMTPFAEFVRQTAGGTAFGAGMIGTEYALADEKPTRRKYGGEALYALTRQAAERLALLPEGTREAAKPGILSETFGPLAEHLMADHDFALDPRETILVGVCGACRRDGEAKANGADGASECDDCL